MGGAAKGGRRVSWDEGMAIARDVLKWLKPVIRQSAVAGSLRRKKVEAGDVDLVVIAKNADLLNVVLAARWGWKKTKPNEAKHSGLWDGVQIDVMVATEEDWGSKLQFLTGSAEENIRLRRKAIARGLLMNEKGVWKLGPADCKERREPTDRVAGKTEASMYEAVGEQYRVPEERDGSEPKTVPCGCSG